MTASVGEPRDIVIIRLNAVGDLILWLESARQLRERFPTRRITLIAAAEWASLASQLPYFDEVVVARPEDCRGRWRYLRQLIRDFLTFRAWTANWVIHPVISRSLHANLIARWIRAEAKTTPAGDDNNMQTLWCRFPGLTYQDSLTWYTDVVETDHHAMELAANAQFTSALVGNNVSTALFNFRCLPAVLKHPFRLPDRYILVAPGARDLRKTWPVARFAEVIRQLPGSIAVVICGAPAEAPATTQLAAIVESSGRTVVNLGGQTSLPQLLAVIAGAEAVLGNDSAAIHIAAAVQVPSVAIVGGGHFGRFVPYRLDHDLRSPHYFPKVAAHPMPCYGCNWNCIFSVPHGAAWPCVDQVPTETVIKATLATFDGQSGV